MVSFFRWIISLPIAIGLIPFLFWIINWIIDLIFKVRYFMTTWGTRWDVPNITDFDDAISDFKYFIFNICLSTLIASGIAGYIGGLIAPKGHSNKIAFVFGIPALLFSILLIVGLWDTEHWFYSILSTINLLLMTAIFTGSAGVASDPEGL